MRFGRVELLSQCWIWNGVVDLGIRICKRHHTHHRIPRNTKEYHSSIIRLHHHGVNGDKGFVALHRFRPHKFDVADCTPFG
jgi:hypothetical protein